MMSFPTTKIVPQEFLQAKPIYLGEAKSQGQRFKAIETKKFGSAVGTIYELSGCKWIGKIGNVTGYLRDIENDIYRYEADINLDAIREYIIGCCYEVAARGAYLTPEIALSKQDIFDPFTNKRAELYLHKEFGIKQSLRIMSAWVDDYKDFAYAETIDEQGKKWGYVPFLIHYHRPPEHLISPEGKCVPLHGDIELFANGRAFADVDVLGGDGKNAGICWIKNDMGEIVGARAVKIDPGYGFQFARQKDDETSTNPVINTKEEIGISKFWLKDLRDTRLALAQDEVIIYWEALTPSQQARFIETLMLTIEAFNEEARMYLLYRNGEFNRADKEKIPESVAREISNLMGSWFNLQKEIYEEGILLRKNVYFDYPSPVQDFIGREALLEELQKRLMPPIEYQATAPTRILLLQGESGSGKSEMARQAAYLLRKHFSLIQWIEGETEQQQLLSYLKLAQTLGLPLEERVSFDFVQKLVHDHLQNLQVPWLLIVDNLESLCTLPTQGGYILITSQNPLLEASDTLQLEPFSEGEGMQFINHLEGSEEDQLNLVNYVKGNPLALHQGAFLIKECQISIRDYLDKIDKLSATWKLEDPFLTITLSGLQHLKENDSLAYRWLQISAFLDPTEIPELWLKNWLIQEKYDIDLVDSQVKTILITLQKYGFIRHNWQARHFFMHRKLYEVLQTLIEDKEIFLSAVSFCLKQSDYDENNIGTWDPARKWLIHATKLWDNLLCTHLNDFQRGDLALLMSEIWGLSQQPHNQYKFAELAYQCRLKKHSNPPLDLAVAAYSLGIACVNINQHEEALLKFQHALSLFRIVDPHSKSPHPKIGDLFLHLGSTCIWLKHYQEAKDYGAQALTAFINIYGNQQNCVKLADTYLFIADCHSRLNEKQEGLKTCNQALEIYQTRYGSDNHPSIAKALMLKSAFYRLKKEYAEALGFAEKSVEILRSFKAQHELAGALVESALCYFSLEKYEASQLDYNQAYTIYRNFYGEASSNPNILTCLKGLIRISIAKQRYEEAAQTCLELLEGNLSFWGKDHPEVGYTYDYLADILLKIPGQEQQAAAYKKQAMACSGFAKEIEKEKCTIS